MKRKEVVISLTKEETWYLNRIYTKEYEFYQDGKEGPIIERNLITLKYAIENDLSQERLVVTSKNIIILYNSFCFHQDFIIFFLEKVDFYKKLNEKFRYAYGELNVEEHE